jgi:hypothetical protein
MDIENARRRLVLPGYKHPEEPTATTRTNIYKTFSEKNTDFGTTIKGKKYATISLETEKCPKCNSEIIHKCQCSFSDKKCSKGHIFYIDRTGETKMGNPHH